MKKTAFTLFGILAMGSAIVFAQSGTKPTAATYITDEEVKSVNALPGVDRTIKVVDIGPENFAVGIIHRGPSCSGMTVGADVVKKAVKTGDIIIIPAGVPHGWIDITDHVDYLSFRPSARVLEAGYTNPAIKK